jgi:hypothetical protein
LQQAGGAGDAGGGDAAVQPALDDGPRFQLEGRETDEEVEEGHVRFRQAVPRL